MRGERRAMAMNGAAKPYGIIAEFTTAADVLHAAQKVRDAGFTAWGRVYAVPGAWDGRGHGIAELAVAGSPSLAGRPATPRGCS